MAVVVSTALAFAPSAETQQLTGFARLFGAAASIQVVWALVSGQRRVVGWAAATLTASYGLSLIGAPDRTWAPLLFTIGLVVYVEAALWSIDARDPGKPVSATARSNWVVITVLGATIAATAIIRAVDYSFEPGIPVHVAAIGAAVAALSVVVVLIRRGT